MQPSCQSEVLKCFRVEEFEQKTFDFPESLKSLCSPPLKTIRFYKTPLDLEHSFSNRSQVCET